MQVRERAFGRASAGPVESGAAARAADDWLVAMGAAPPAAARPFGAVTLKQVLDQALALGAAAGRLDAAMQLVADIERRLGALAAALRIDRRAGTVAGRPAPRVAIVTGLAEDDLILGGRWVPGLAAAAGLSALGVSEGEDDARVGPAGLSRLAPEALVFAPAGLSVEAAMAAADDLRTAVSWRDIRAIRAGRVHVIDGERHLIRPGPEIARSAELLAFVVHGERAGVTPAPGEALVGNGPGAE